VIIVNWNGRHLLHDCLSSLRLQNFSNFETILVDNGSSDGSAQFVATKFPEIRIIRLAKNRGFAGGNNIGIREAKGEYVVLLNNDTEVASDWLKELYLAIDSDDSIAACDSKVLYFNKRNIIWSAGAKYSIAGTVEARGQNRNDDLEYQQSADVFVAVACSAIYRKKVFEEIGMLDEDFFAGYEDVDWSFRAHLHGYRIINVPASKVYHKVSATHKYNSDMFVYNGQKNVTYVFLKNMPLPLLYKYLPFHMFYIAGSLLYFSRISKLWPFIKAKIHVLRTFHLLLHKRCLVQRGRTVGPAEIECLLDHSWFASKLAKYKTF